jgi:hypothetical protein
MEKVAARVLIPPAVASPRSLQPGCTRLWPPRVRQRVWPPRRRHRPPRRRFGPGHHISRGRPAAAGDAGICRRMLKWAGLRELADELLPFFRRDAKHPGLFLGCFHGPRSTSTSPDWLWKQTEVMISWAAFLAHVVRIRGGCSGYPISSGRVIWVLRNSGNENHYPISAPEKHYPQIRVPAKIGFGFGLPNLPEISNQSIQLNTHNFA